MPNGIVVFCSDCFGFPGLFCHGFVALYSMEGVKYWENSVSVLERDWVGFLGECSELAASLKGVVVMIVFEGIRFVKREMETRPVSSSFALFCSRKTSGESSANPELFPVWRQLTLLINPETTCV
jgi:hypothetical protein